MSESKGDRDWEAREVSQPWIEILGPADAEGSREIIGSVRAPYGDKALRDLAMERAKLLASAPRLAADLERVREALEAIESEVRRMDEVGLIDHDLYDLRHCLMVARAALASLSEKGGPA